MALFFILSAIETLSIGIYLISIDSEKGNQILFNLSLSRLISSSVIFFIAVVFFFLAIKAIRSNKNEKGLFSFLLVNKKTLLIIFSFSILIILSMFYLLTRKPDFGGDLKLILEQLEPVFVWMLVLSSQTSFFIILWFCTYFLINKEKKSINTTKKELLQVFAVFIIALIAKWFIVSSASFGPTGIGDEMTYYDMADSLNRGFFRVAQTYHYPPLYPLVILPALVFGKHTFTLIKLINAVITTSIIFPTYLISRSFLDSNKSLIPTLISCFIPFHLVFPRRIVSENLFFSILLWTMFFTLKKTSTKTSDIIWDILTGIGLGLLYLTRYISLAIIPMFLISWWIKPFNNNDVLLKPHWEKVLRLLLIVIVTSAVFSPWIIGAINEGVPIKLALGFGITSRTNPDQLTFRSFLTWLGLYSSYLIIIASPTLPLLFKSISFVKIREWRDEFGRWILQVIILIGGFLIAATRHSWRAFYNESIPMTMMGRYVVFFSIPFLILSFVTLDSQKIKTNFNVNKSNIGLLLISVFLVLISYFLVIDGKIILIGNNLLRPDGSVDGHYVKELGNLFFPLIGVLYFLYLYSFSLQKNRILLKIIAIVLIAFYTCGWPGYYRLLKTNQLYPWLSSEISDMARTSITEKELSDGISLFIPSSIASKQRSELYNGLRVRGIDNTKVIVFNDKKALGMPTKYGIMVSDYPGVNLSDNSTEKHVKFIDKDFFLSLVIN